MKHYTVHQLDYETVCEPIMYMQVPENLKGDN